MSLKVSAKRLFSLHKNNMLSKRWNRQFNFLECIQTA